jgi:hypothetical protein
VRTFVEYARVDFAIGDNDPVYFAVRRAAKEWGGDWARRFCVGMMTYYHMGTAVKAADRKGEDFWNYLRIHHNDSPRGAARRHSRGQNGVLMLDSMQRYAPQPEYMFQRMPSKYMGIKKECENHLYGFGPYFWLKIADYMDRCLGFSMDYAGLENNLSTEPARAAQLLYPDKTIPEAFRLACFMIDRQPLSMLAPPAYDRPVGPAEVETALCDWSHAKKGSNWLGADLIVKRDALRGYGDKAAQMAEWLPPLISREQFKLELI